MTTTSLDIRQSQTRVLQDQLDSAATTQMDSVLASINNELTAPGRLIAAATPSLVVTINSGTVVNPNTSKNRVLPFVSNVSAGFTGGTITFPSTSGTITVSPGTNATITIGVSQFVAVLVQLNASGQLSLVVGNAASSLGTVVIPSGSSSLLSLGYIIVQSNASSVIQPVTNAMLYQFVGGGGGGSGSGSGVGDDLDSLQFQASFTDLFPENDTISTSSINSSGTNASFNAGKNIYTMSYDASKTVTGSSVNMTLSGTPAFTVVAGDMLIVGTEARKIITVTSQTVYVLESAFTVTPSPSTAACTVSQAVYTKDIYNLAVDGSAISAAFPSSPFSEIMVVYKDTATSGTNVFVPDVAPVVAWTATNDNTNFTLLQNRQTNITTQDTSTILPSSGSNLFLRFFAKESSGSGTVNLLMYKVFMQKAVTAGSNTNAVWSSYATTNSSTTPINCTVGVSGGKTTITFTNGNTYPLGVLAGQTVGALEVILNGQIIDRFVSGSTPSTDAYYTEVSPTVIQLDQNYSLQQMSILVKYSNQVIDSSTTNTTQITALQGVQSAGFQGFISQTDFINTATTTTGSPAAGTFYSSVQNRASMVDLSQDLKPRMGIERIVTQQIQLMQGEFGPNGEQVFSTPNDTFGQIRFVGAWTADDNSTAHGGAGERVTSNSTGDFVEITFYGTGLNALNYFNASAPSTVSSSVDGVVVSSNVYTITSSSVLNGRNYGQNLVFPIVSGLALGIHTVQIKTTSVGSLPPVYYGFEILNESSSVKVNSGIGYIGGQKYASTSQSAFSYSAPVTGTAGGRVLVYQTSGGSIGQAFTPTNSQATLTSTNHTNEEVARTYEWREFGAGRADDLSGNLSAGSNATFTLDDDTTTLVCNQITVVTGTRETLGYNTTNSAIAFTFVGTGLDYVSGLSDGSTYTGNFTVIIDGTTVASNVSVATLFGRSTRAGPKTWQIASGLPYGTHNVKIIMATNGVVEPLFQFVVYQPKKPALPAGAIELADYNVLATYVANSTASQTNIGTGVIRKQNNREWIYVGSGWSTSIGSSDISGWQFSDSTTGDYFQYTFFGTGFDFRLTSNATSSTWQMTLDGSTNLSGFTTSFYGAGITSFTPSTGTFVMSASNPVGNGISVSNLTLGVHTLKITKTAGTGALLPSALDIITPIYSAKSNLYADYQNTLLVGSNAISDNRKITPVKDALSAVKAWSQAQGVSVSPTTTSSTLVPMPDMSTTVKTNGGPIRIAWEAELGGSVAAGAIQCQLYVDGAAVGTLVSINQAVASDTQLYSYTFKLPVSPGAHKVDLYWLISGGGTLTATGTRRILLVEET